jgi:ATP phosphoribosyltransferase regulatory subunit
VKLEEPVPPTVLAQIRTPFLEVGAEALDAPTVQPLGQLLDLAGEALRERLFVLQSDGGEEACLRPDFTIAAARAFVAAGASSARYYYEGHGFRVAPPGASRAEEFLQLGLEVFGSSDRAPQDADIATIAWRAAAAGGRDDLALTLGDVALFSAFIESLDLSSALRSRLERSFSSPRRLWAELSVGGDEPAPRAGDRLADLLGDLSESEAAGALEEIWRLSGIQAVGGRSALEIVHRLRERSAIAKAPHLSTSQAEPIRRFLAISDRPATALEAISRLAGSGDRRLRAGLEAWERRLSALLAQGVPPEAMTFSAAFGRAFGYYDGPLFEIRSAALGDDQPVAAGGRYDTLPGRLGGKASVGAVGCMVRPGRAWAGSAP